MRAWLDGVRSSEHGGAALQKFAFHHNRIILENECAASTMLIDALSLQSLYAVCRARQPAFVMQGGEVWAAFVQAMRDGAPCARTLRKLRVNDPSIEPYLAELRSILPHLMITVED